ncbi:DUF7149 domain-containing protein [Pontibacter burrus]|uniref:DUF7149 domain-containing protein n=1 Tax=Pontibacter burrus TaxID=2704466 RepID=A0A6B3LW85_9BACT|nr:hypothetical protein [Pontibacter burrus]NEM97701.1 hypothetical protein [Pontibacter burrus]
MPSIILHPKLAPFEANLTGKIPHAMEADFKRAFQTLLSHMTTNYSLEHVKNKLHSFLECVYYDKYSIDGRDGNCLTIQAGKDAESNTAVLLKVAEPTNYSLTPEPNIQNCKALHELVLAFLAERSVSEIHLKKLIITTGHEWCVFDALDFERLILSNKQLLLDFKNRKTGSLSKESDSYFINTSIAPYLKSLPSDALPFIYINLKDYYQAIQQDKTAADDILLMVFHVLSPEFNFYSFTEEDNSGEYNSPVCYEHLNGMREGFEL